MNASIYRRTGEERILAGRVESAYVIRGTHKKNIVGEIRRPFVYRGPVSAGAVIGEVRPPFVYWRTASGERVLVGEIAGQFIYQCSDRTLEKSVVGEVEPEGTRLDGENMALAGAAALLLLLR